MADLNTNVRYIKGIGETRAKALEKLGVRTLRDLIGFFPRRYEDRSVIYPIAELPVGETACCRAMIAAVPTSRRIPGGRTVVKVRAVDETGTLDVTFFNQAYRQSLRPGDSFVFCGKVEGNLLRRQMVNPLMEPDGQHQLTGRIMPVYPLTRGVSQLLLQKAVRQGLDACRELLPDVLPDAVRMTHQLCSVPPASRHWPRLTGGCCSRSCFLSPAGCICCAPGGWTWRARCAVPLTCSPSMTRCPSH